MNKNRTLWLVLAGSLACVVVMLALESPGQAASSQSSGCAATTFTPTLYFSMTGNGPPSLNPADFPSPNCRYGIATFGADQQSWLPAFNAGWHLDFSAHAPTGLSNIEYAQVIRVHQYKNGCTYLAGYSVSPPLTDSGLGALVSTFPGSLWIVGNEPDRGPNPGRCNGGQDDIFPEVYAEAYHDVHSFIKQRDPTAQVAIAGLVEVTPGRLQYLDKVWQAYLQKYGTSMPVDVWNMHLYILPEALPDGQPNGVANVALGTDPALAIRESGNDPARCADPKVYCWAEHDNLSIFAEQVVAMRTWMKQHGQQDRPLILSEYSILYPFKDYDDPVNPTTCWLQDEYGQCFTSVRVSNFMTRTFSYLETAADPSLGHPLDQHRLVQQWLWFSMYFDNYDVGYVSNLLTDDLASLTLPGQTFSNTVKQITTYANLFPARVAYPVAFVPAPGETVSATLSVGIYNNGNTYAADPITVTFYSNAALTEIIDSVVITGTLGGCARRVATATATWTNLTAGSHYYWVKVEGDPFHEEDNVAEGLVLVNPRQIFLPLVLR